MPPDKFAEISFSRPPGHSGGLFLARKLVTPRKPGNKKAEQKPRFLECRDLPPVHPRSTNHQQLLFSAVVRREYDSLEMRLLSPSANMRLVEMLHIRSTRKTPRDGPLLAA
ncbi:hypothetical protein [Mesorhizobium sp. B2-4-6]|uniref:hypothetical protein n=1 Tax=Mesorhizobium sp. B2-4-6 TaxID=2589943 RepID=UPI001128DA77|nr:hypothetical protein [Mesorhizobium sp. B2-4-6]TPL51251.1 hypothetical protein FJ957_06550 [Mesorhizobium sp. B2-4-6]